MFRYALVDDRVVLREEAVVPAFDRGYLLGEGVFETMRVERGVPLWADDHADRLRHACRAIGVRGDAFTAQRIVDAVAALVEAEADVDPGIGARPLGARITVTARGASEAEVVTEPRMTAFLRDLPLHAGEPVDVVEASFRRDARNPVSAIKATSYLENQLALAAAQAQGADEAVFLDLDGGLTEGTRTNVFFVRHGRLETPPLEAGLLGGILRGRVLRLAERLQIPHAERKISVSDVASSGEGFLTNALRGIVPIRRFGSVTLPEAPGAITRSLGDAFERAVAEYLRHASAARS